MPARAASHGNQAEVLVDGVPLAADVQPALARAVVDSHLHLPDMVVLVFQDTERDVLSRARIRFGTRLVVSVAPTGGGDPVRLITAEVTALEQESDATGAWTVVRGYDLSHRLCRGRRTRTFADTTDAAIVREVAGDAGLELGTIDADGPTYPHVSQVNLTDWEFLRGRAVETGHDLTVADGKVQWRAPQRSTDAPGADADLAAPARPRQLVLGGNLLRFRPRVTAAEQVSEVHVRGWDPSTKRAVVGVASGATTSARVGVDPAALASTFSAGPAVVVDRPVTSQTEADTVATAVAEQIASAHAEAEGVAYGDPNLVPGTAVAVSGVGWPHDGSYVLTAVRHCIDESGYLSEFTVSGRQERSLLGLASVGATAGPRRAAGPPVPGVVIGQVTDVADPDHGFRVKLSFPWLSDQYESWWAPVAQPGAGAGRGMAWLPEVGDEVLVAFAYGDIRAPYVLGGLFNGVDPPPMADGLVDSGTGKVTIRPLVSRSGHQLVLSDDESASKMSLGTGDGKLTITLDATGTEITVDSAGTVTISGSKGVRVTSDSELAVHASGSLKISGDSDVSVQASGRLSLSGQAGVAVDGGPSVDVSGQVIKLN